MTTVFTTREELQAWSKGAGQRAVVMTMGALHEGHAHLMDVARERVGANGQVIVTDFVNAKLDTFSLGDGIALLFSSFGEFDIFFQRSLGRTDNDRCQNGRRHR